VQFPRIRRFPGWFAYCLCLFIPVLAGCGDFCLFCEGQGSGGGGNGNGDEKLCDTPFSGLDDYQFALDIKEIDVFEEQRDGNDRLSIAVIPKGMSFKYGTSNQTANPGDVILADQLTSDILTSDIYVYEYGSSQTGRSLGIDVGRVSGVALLHQEIDEETDADLLFFTVETDNTLYIYDLTGSDDPVPITNDDLDDFFGGNDFLESPTALAVSADAEKAVVFVLNDDGTNSSVRRLSVSLSTTTPDPSSLQTIATMEETSRRLVDIAFFHEPDALHEADALFVSKRVEFGAGVAGWVYRIANASDRTGSVDLESAVAFIEEDVSVTGLEVAFMDKQGTTADLLVLREDVGVAGQFDIIQQGAAEAGFDFREFYQYPQAIAYDCTNERLVMIDIPPNLVPPAGNRTFFEAFPTQ
jgi:hypothetical protein